MTDSKDSGSLFGINADSKGWVATPLTREALLRVAALIAETWRKQVENPQPHVMYETQANLQQMGDDLEADGEAWPARVNRDENGRVTSIEW